MAKNISLSSLSTFKIGGAVKEFLRVHDREELIRVLISFAETKTAFKIIGSASNIVFPDGILQTIILQYLGGKKIISGNRLMCDAGVTLSEVIKLSIVKGLQGLESLSGIPGTVSGAVVGNAGVYGHSMSEVVEKVEIWDGKKIWWLRNSDCRFSYRESLFEKTPHIILSVVFNFKKAGSGPLQSLSRSIIKARRTKYKPGLKCPGSFFKNILVKDVKNKSLDLVDRTKIIDGKIPAGYLLDSVGAKNMQVGDIMISNFHGNLFINKGKGNAGNVKKLANLLKKKVSDRFGITLMEEIRYF